MSWYEILLFVHIAAVVVWLGGAAMIQFFALRALPAGAERTATLAADAEVIGMRVFTPASLLVLLAGIGLVIEGPWGFGDDWIVIALVLFAVTFLAGLLFFAPESGRVAKAVEAHGIASQEAQSRIRRIIILSRLDLILLFLVAYDMIVKPEFDDTGAIVLGLAIALAAAALVLWRWRSGQGPRTAAATSSVD
jgi:uncharacterized membrane protein